MDLKVVLMKSPFVFYFVLLELVGLSHPGRLVILTVVQLSFSFLS